MGYECSIEAQAWDYDRRDALDLLWAAYDRADRVEDIDQMLAITSAIILLQKPPACRPNYAHHDDTAAVR